MNGNITTDEFDQRSLWSRVKEKIGFSEELEEEFDDTEAVRDEIRKRPGTLKLYSTKVSYVSVRQPQSFDDARLAADGLKDGRQQIVNLEKTDPAMSERIIDFLNGVTYALNGFVEKVGDRVYLFAPSNFMIDAPDDLHKSSPGLFDITSS